MSQNKVSIFKEYYSPSTFVDRFLASPDQAVDVIIPVMHSNELWEKNLISFYREIPIKHLLIGDGGVVDQTIEVTKRFPRVIVFDHRDYVSLGYSIRKLIEEVKSDWFVYVHSDVYLPEGWFDAMKSHQSEFDWFQCRQLITTLIEYEPYEDKEYRKRAYSGSQMGRKEAFTKVLPKIDDDFLYRNEDIIISELVKSAGYKYGHVSDMFCYHQQIEKQSTWSRKIKSIEYKIEKSPEEEFREHNTQIRGIIKYLHPENYLVRAVNSQIFQLHESGNLDWAEFMGWVNEVNPIWLHHLTLKPTLFRRLIAMARSFLAK